MTTNAMTLQEIERKVFLQPLSDLVAKLRYDQRLQRAWQLIETDYSDPDLSLEKVARVSGINKNYLNALLRQTTLFTFHQILIRYRILKATRMMKNKNYTLLEIALLSGFGSLNTLERNFGLLLAMTPREFKRRWSFSD
jgi:two-component system, response regulator YesN